MEKIIVLNHKMNMEYEEVQNYLKNIKELEINPIIFPTAIYAKEFVDSGIKTGLQNIYSQNSGPYTGEISPSQAKSIGIDYVLIGHFERRKIFKETNKDINEKIKAAINNNLKVILCVGEGKNENQEEIIKTQIIEGLKDIKEEIIIAYEPTWAIGSNEMPNKKELENIIKYIKSFFDYDIMVLYGGSVGADTIKTIKEVNAVSGYLIGGNSTNISELKKIKEVIS